MHVHWMNRARLSLVVLAAFFAAVMGPESDTASAGEINTGYFGNVAIEGYDPVAYFTMKKAVKGSDKFTHKWLGAVWQFANAEHRDLFMKKPISYAPQYGGFCADGMAYGTTTANLDPEAFRIIDGKLYLNHDEGAAIELEETADQIAKADAMWEKQRPLLINQQDN